MAAATAQDLPSSPPFQTSETGFFRHLVSFVDSGNVLLRWKSGRECPLRAAANSFLHPTRKGVACQRERELRKRSIGHFWQIIWRSLNPLIRERHKHHRLSRISKARSARTACINSSKEVENVPTSAVDFVQLFQILSVQRTHVPRKTI